MNKRLKNDTERSLSCMIVIYVFIAYDVVRSPANNPPPIFIVCDAEQSVKGERTKRGRSKTEVKAIFKRPPTGTRDSGRTKSRERKDNK